MKTTSMHIRKSSRAWLLALFLGCSLGTVSTDAAARTLQEAVAEVESQTGGKILSAETIRVGRQVIYRIKVLTPEGRIQVFQIPA